MNFAEIFGIRKKIKFLGYRVALFAAAEASQYNVLALLSGADSRYMYINRKLYVAVKKEENEKRKGKGRRRARQRDTLQGRSSVIDLFLCQSF